MSLDPAPPIIHARFDPDAKVIPMPTDVLRDAATQRLDLLTTPPAPALVDQAMAHVLLPSMLYREQRYKLAK
jgi:hypothetical protein